MAIRTICECDGCSDKKAAYENSNYPMPVGWSKVDVATRGEQKNDVTVKTFFFCDTCHAVAFGFTLHRKRKYGRYPRTRRTP